MHPSRTQNREWKVFKKKTKTEEEGIWRRARQQKNYWREWKIFKVRHVHMTRFSVLCVPSNLQCKWHRSHNSRQEWAFWWTEMKDLGLMNCFVFLFLFLLLIHTWKPWILAKYSSCFEGCTGEQGGVGELPFKPMASAVGDVPFIRSSLAIVAELLDVGDILKKELEGWFISLGDK